MPVFVLAAGETSRFEADYPKQHIEIEGERLLDRIEKQARWDKALLVTHRGDLEWRGSMVMPAARRFTSETVLSTEPWWEHFNTVLFSDVWFTDEAMMTIRDCTLPIAFFTGGRDIFAFKFNATRFHQIIPALEYAIQRAPMDGGNHGRIWEVYRHIYGMPTWPLTPEMNPPGVVFIGDRTQDFDTVQDLEDFKAGKSKNYLFSQTHG